MDSEIDPTLIDAYENTQYTILEPKVSILLNHKNPILDKWLEEKNVSSWAFITAFNPYSILLPEEKNLAAQDLFREKIASLGLSFLEGKGESANGDFPTEDSLFIFGISKEKSMEIATELEQNAFLFGSIYENSEILYTQ